MTQLLVVTDHRYFRSGDRIVDTYCFDRSFFDDYRVVFQEVTVAARIRSDHPPAGARPADGDSVSFVALPDLRGGKWAAAPWLPGFPQLRTAVRAADAVCLRIPSASSHAAFRYAMAENKPLMFEMIGHPVESWRGQSINATRRAFIALDHWMIKRIVARSVVGSYVSSNYLQNDYPPSPRTTTAAISSIRLCDSDFTRVRDFPSTRRPLKIVCVGSLVPVKSHRTLLQAIAAARASAAAFDVVLAGDGPERDSLLRLAKDLGISGFVDFRGHITDRNDLRQLLDESDLFVMTSLSEGLPRSMLEGLARGLPAIGTSVGGIMELLPADQLFPPENISALATLLCRLYGDRQILSRWSRDGFEKAHRFSQAILSARRQGLLTLLHEATLLRPAV